MKLFMIISKRNLVLALAIGLVLISVLVRGFFVRAGTVDGSTDEKRAEYFKSIGVSVEDKNADSKQIIIPQSFDDVYSEYNSLQKKAGFDLAPYKGESAVVYTYRLSGDEYTQAHLIVSDGKIIGGDISSVKLDGEMKPLVK